MISQPTKFPGGTGEKKIHAQWEKASAAAWKLENEIDKCAPHSRDYAAPNYSIARSEWESLVGQIQKITTKIDAIVQELEENINSGGPLNEETRSLSAIASEIRKDWGAKMSYSAKPYVDAMLSLNTIRDDYGEDTAFAVVSYFLANAGSWRGETAKRIKAELKVMLKGA